MLPVGYYLCVGCGCRQEAGGACGRCGRGKVYHKPGAPRIWPCRGCGRPIWDGEVCGPCDEAQCPVCFSFQQGQVFGLGCRRCGFKPYGTMEEAAGADLMGAGPWGYGEEYGRRAGDKPPPVDDNEGA